MVASMPAADIRFCVAEVSEESRDGWGAFSRLHGVNRTALAEVIGLRLGGMHDTPPPFLRQCIRDALELEERRRTRRADG